MQIRLLSPLTFCLALAILTGQGTLPARSFRHESISIGDDAELSHLFIVSVFDWILLKRLVRYALQVIH